MQIATIHALFDYRSGLVLPCYSPEPGIGSPPNRCLIQEPFWQPHKKRLQVSSLRWRGEKEAERRRKPLVFADCLLHKATKSCTRENQAVPLSQSGCAASCSTVRRKSLLRKQKPCSFLRPAGNMSIMSSSLPSNAARLWYATDSQTPRWPIKGTHADSTLSYCAR